MTKGVIISNRSSDEKNRASEEAELDAGGGGALISIPGGGWSIADPDADGGAERVQLVYDEPPGPWVYEVHGQPVDGRPVITSMLIRQRDPENPTPITRQALRSAPIGILQERVRRVLRTAWANRVEETLGLSRMIRPKAGRSRTAEHYLQVAWWYGEAQATGKAPRKAIAERWSVSLVTASRWLAEARRRGYLSGYQPVRKDSPPTADSDRQIEARIFATLLIEMAYDVSDEPRRCAAAALLAVIEGSDSAGTEPTA